MAQRRRFEWDEAKARANEAKHRLSFRFAAAVFDDDNRLELDASRPEDGEVRSKVVGMIDGSLYTVVFVMRGESYRIISARRSNRREERNYGDRSLHA
jgi:uncharacterized DUF497 family protein